MTLHGSQAHKWGPCVRISRVRWSVIQHISQRHKWVSACGNQQYMISYSCWSFQAVCWDLVRFASLFDNSRISIMRFLQFLMISCSLVRSGQFVSAYLKSDINHIGFLQFLMILNSLVRSGPFPRFISIYDFLHFRWFQSVRWHPFRFCPHSGRLCNIRASHPQLMYICDMLVYRQYHPHLMHTQLKPIMSPTIQTPTIHTYMLYTGKAAHSTYICLCEFDVLMLGSAIVLVCTIFRGSLGKFRVNSKIVQTRTIPIRKFWCQLGKCPN